MSKPSIDDLCFVSGGLIVASGAGMIYAPAGVVVLGLFLIVVSIGLQRNK